MLVSLVNDVLETMWKEAVLAYFGNTAGIFLEGLSKIAKTNQDSWCIGADSKRPLPYYRSAA